MIAIQKLREGKETFLAGAYGAYVLARLHERRDYLLGKLRDAVDWPNYCRISGELAATERALTILALQELERRDGDGEDVSL